MLTRRRIRAIAGSALAAPLVLGVAVSAQADPNKPNIPDDLRTTSPTTSCAGSDDRPWIWDDSPVLRATTSSDFDDQLRAEYQLEFFDVSAGDFAKVDEFATSFGPAGERAAEVSDLAEGEWRWRARAEAVGAKSKWSEWCYLQVDTTPPGSAEVSISEPYSFEQWVEAPDLPIATLTVSRDGDDDAVGFRVFIDGVPHDGVFDGETAEFEFAPDFGVTQIRVRLVDRAGNLGPETIETVGVLPPPIEHAWMLNEDTPGVAPDKGGLDLTFGVDVAWVDGDQAEYFDVAEDRALWFDATGPGATTAAPAVDPAASFTVTARVRLEELAPSGDFVAVSQDSGMHSAFNLGLQEGRWTFWGTSADGTAVSIIGSEPIDEVGGDPIPILPDGEPDWQHLAAVYNATMATLTFYVDGDVVGETDFEFGSVSTGPFRVGQGLAAGEFVSAIPAGVDDVVVTQAALSDAMVRELVTIQFEDQLP